MANKWRRTMSEEFRCDECARASGCTARHTEEKAVEEMKAGPYLFVSAVIIVLAALAVKWLF
jgi:hypothetical protein